MSQLFKFTDTCWLDPERVSEVRCEHNLVSIHMHDGRVHTSSSDYGKSAMETARRLVKEINDARAK